MPRTSQRAPENAVDGEEGSAKVRRGKSSNPSAIRKRMRTAGAHMESDLKMLQEAQMAKYKPIEEWTLEELANGKPRNENGTFVGAKPKWITPMIQEEVQRRLRAETLVGFDREAASAVKVLVDFLSDKEEPQLRFKAAQLILEYVVGKPEQKVHLSGNVQLQAMLADVILLPDGNEAHPIVLPGEFTEELEEADDDDDG